MNPQRVLASEVSSTAYEPYPVGKVHTLRHEPFGDGEMWSGVWHVSPDELPARSLHESEHNETFHILDGNLVLEIEDGPTLELGPGSIVSLAQGTRARWTIVTAVKEFFVYVSAAPSATAVDDAE
jgi:uncharacterized cupin superfamily protein